MTYTGLYISYLHGKDVEQNMDEYEIPMTDTDLTENHGDVDDLIFYNDFEWYVSDR